MGKRVLIVEDDRDIREPMRELLEQEGYLVDCASTGTEALERIRRQENPRIILCDLMMPNMNGIELIETLRSQNHTKAVDAMVILSAAAHAKQTATELGVGFLRKPIDIDALLNMVQQYCT